MVKKFNEMFEGSSIEKKIEEILNSPDAKKLILDEISNAYKSGFEYAWTRGQIGYTVNKDRRKREGDEFKNEMDLRLKEYIEKGSNEKSGTPLYKSPSIKSNWLDLED